MRNDSPRESFKRNAHRGEADEGYEGLRVASKSAAVSGKSDPRYPWQVANYEALGRAAYAAVRNGL
jgi:hypothetical protein